MTEHQKAADYHRTQARKEFDWQGTPGYKNPADHAASRSRQESHQRAAGQADRAHAEITGQIVEYTPIGKPVFRKKY